VKLSRVGSGAKYPSSFIRAQQASAPISTTWVKAVHVIAVISWMAGMLYLPRLFVYHCEAEVGSIGHDADCRQCE
jgi:hypothetical protein